VSEGPKTGDQTIRWRRALAVTRRQIGSLGARKSRWSAFADSLLLAAGVNGGIALVGIILFILPWQGTRYLGLSIIVIGAAASIGMLAGFLFGVPKSAAVSREGARSEIIFQHNTNLEDVSDWLTKIIIGIGLVEFKALASALGGLATRIGIAFGDSSGETGAGYAYSLGLMIAGAVVGFLLMYMWVRTRFYEVLSPGDALQLAELLQHQPSPARRA